MRVNRPSAGACAAIVASFLGYKAAVRKAAQEQEEVRLKFQDGAAERERALKIDERARVEAERTRIDTMLGDYYGQLSEDYRVLIEEDG